MIDMGPNMYSDEILRIPRNENELWEILGEQFEWVRQVLWDLPVQELDHVLEKTEFKWSPGAGEFIVYRGKSPADARDNMLKCGRELLPYIHQAIDERTFTPEFVQQWGKIMFYHGFITSYAVDESTNTRHLKGGSSIAAVAYARKKWISKVMMPMLASGMSRKDAETAVHTKIRKIIDTDAVAPPFDKSWFESLISYGELKSTFDQKHLAKVAMKKLCAEPDDDIPPYDT